MAEAYFNKDQRSGYTGQTGLATAGRQRNGLIRLWRAIRQLFPATASELAELAELSDSTALTYLNWLERAGYIWREPRPSRLYWMIRNTGRHAPQMRDNFTALYDPNTDDEMAVPSVLERWPSEPVPVGSPEHRIWQAMRMLRNFTVSELAIVTELDAAQVRVQVHNLHSFNYLRETERSFGEPSYLLPKYRDTGDKPPAVNTQLGKLYDYKTKEIISIRG